MKDRQTALPGTGTGSDQAEDPGFEALVDELDGIVGRLEAGELSLEESLAAFERGVEVSRQASTILDAAEQRIEKLTGTPDAPHAQPFE